jgi:hypothetical protein
MGYYSKNGGRIGPGRIRKKDGIFDIIASNLFGDQLYAFNSAVFTTGGLLGSSGPNLSQARAGLGNPSWSNTYLNMTVNGIQEWTVPKTANYRITANGAAGGSNGGVTGGNPTSMTGTFSLIEGQILKILVGQSPVVSSNNCGGVGGGGGSFVTYSNNQPLVVAGGGGGAGQGAAIGSNANTGGSAIGGSNTNGSSGSGGSEGSAGCSGPLGGGGGGLTGDGVGSNPGRSFANGGSGGSGFGGGAGANYGGGGGGGYSGASGGNLGGDCNCSVMTAGGGGGSINNGSNQINVVSTRTEGSIITIVRL